MDKSPKTCSFGAPFSLCFWHLPLFSYKIIILFAKFCDLKKWILIEYSKPLLWFLSDFFYKNWHISDLPPPKLVVIIAYKKSCGSVFLLFYTKTLNQTQSTCINSFFQNILNILWKQRRVNECPPDIRLPVYTTNNFSNFVSN